MMRQMNRALIKGQMGLTLVEVLVAVLVLSIGLLGLAALQGISLQSSQGAYFRTQATNAAYEVADFARANRISALDDCEVPDMDTAKEVVNEQLPQGDIEAVFTDCSTGEIQVEVSWHEGRYEDGGGVEKIQIVTRI